MESAGSVVRSERLAASKCHGAGAAWRLVPLAHLVGVYVYRVVRSAGVERWTSLAASGRVTGAAQLTSRKLMCTVSEVSKCNCDANVPVMD